MPKVFLSHAGSDTASARQVADLLAESSVEAILDRGTIGPGDSTATFMNQGLGTADYCLLLWSEAASTRPWVTIEWEAALYRSGREARAFLVVGRLENREVPPLLAPRLYVDLFPDPRRGMDELLKHWHLDRTAERRSEHPVGAPALEPTADAAGAPLYLSSELFGLTIPLRLSLDVPAGVHLDRLINDLKLPLRFDHQGRIGMTFEYALALADRPLVRGRPLAAQSVRPGDVLELQVQVTPFAAVAPREGAARPLVFRGGGGGQRTGAHAPDDAQQAAREALHAALATAGLLAAPGKP
ncbi:MAG: toll/interleukin-1 receptor domain-containing protein [Myxococcales bacterium]|nr:toll/interleukin-1 receptor domain-containing protein [Myxococcales bacterium]